MAGSVNKKCEYCGSPFMIKDWEARQGRGRYCSSKCFHESRIGKRSPNWRGGRKKTCGGYIEIYCPKHQHSDSNGYVKEHILVMTESIGRPLNPNEVVHHINGKRDDNRIENLMIIDRGDHIRMHKLGSVFSDKHKENISLAKKKIVIQRNGKGQFLKGAVYGK